MEPCPFCHRVKRTNGKLRNDHAVAFQDAFPVADGHFLIVPKRHVTNLFDLRTVEMWSVMELIDGVRMSLQHSTGVNSFNIGANVGEAAGQTVGHAHVHVIPRRKGDVEDPRGGIRWVLPERAAYWET